MIQFNYNGQIIDLYQDTNLSYKRQNFAFAFGDLELSRSASFAIPATKRNNDIFGFGCDPNFDGSIVRQTFNVQMQYDGGVESGILYIESCELDEYNCVFVFGNLLPLKAMSEGGKIGEHISELQRELSAIPSKEPKDVDANDYWLIVRYLNNLPITNYYDYNKPAFRYSKAFENTQSLFGITVDLPQDAQNYWFIPKAVKTPKEREMTLSTINWSINPFFTRQALPSYGGTHTNIGVWASSPYGAMKIKIPTSLSNDWFLIYDTDMSTYLAHEFKFVGGYEFDDDKVVSGIPLAGREVQIEKNANFRFVNINDYVPSLGFYDTEEMTTKISTDLTINVVASYGFDSVVMSNNSGGYIFLTDNVPDTTYTDVLKKFCILLNKRMTYSNGVLSFEDFDIDDWDIVKPNIIKLSKLERTYNKFAQNNIVSFTNDQYVTSPIIQNYTITNASLDDEKSFYKFTECCGQKSANSLDPVVLFDDVSTEDGTTYKYTNENPMIGYQDTQFANQHALFAVSLPQNSLLQQLCDKSTSMQLQASMTMFDFMNMKDNSRLYINGNLYIWTSATWSKGVATIEIQKL